MPAEALAADHIFVPLDPMAGCDLPAAFLDATGDPLDAFR